MRALHDSAVLSSRNVDVNNCGKANFAGCPRDGWNGAMFPTMSIPAVPLYKFVLGFQQARACRSCTSPAGVAVLLNERHANRNVAHAMKDAFFLAHVLRHRGLAPIRRVIIADPEPGNKVRAHREGVLRALLSEPRSPPVIWLDRKSSDVHECYETVVQKNVWYAGDAHSADLLRRRVWQHCKVPAERVPRRAQGAGAMAAAVPADVLLLEVHGVRTRQFTNLTRLTSTLQAQPFARGLRIEVVDFSELAFCEQVLLMQRARVAVMHHGAAVAGNGVFLQPSSLLIEIHSQQDGAWDFHETLYDGGFGKFALASGTRYLGARVATAEGPPAIRRSIYDHVMRSPMMTVGINESRWQHVLETANTLLGVTEALYDQTKPDFWTRL